MPENKELKPSDFSNAGRPSCSIWGKTEIEILAWCYVTTMARNGDEWKPVTAQQCLDSLTEQEMSIMRSDLQRIAEGRGDGWWNAVVERVTDADGADSVGGFWRRYHVEKHKAEVTP